MTAISKPQLLIERISLQNEEANVIKNQKVGKVERLSELLFMLSAVPFVCSQAALANTSARFLLSPFSGKYGGLELEAGVLYTGMATVCFGAGLAVRHSPWLVAKIKALSNCQTASKKVDLLPFDPKQALLVSNRFAILLASMAALWELSSAGKSYSFGDCGVIAVKDYYYNGCYAKLASAAFYILSTGILCSTEKAIELACRVKKVQKTEHTETEQNAIIEQQKGSKEDSITPQEVAKDLQELIKMAYDYRQGWGLGTVRILETSLGEKLGNWSLQNRALMKIRDKDFSTASKEEVKRDVADAIALIERGFIQFIGEVPEEIHHADIYGMIKNLKKKIQNL